MDSTILLGFILGLLAGIIITYLWRRMASQNTIEVLAKKLLAKKQEAFIAIASHYLLTPISVIQSAVNRLNEKPNLELSKRQELYETIIAGEKRLYIIAEQMLLAVKLINGELNLSPKISRLHDSVIEAMRETESIAKQKGVTFTTDIQQAPPIELSFDPKQIKTATVALIDNAIKFSHEKGLVQIIVRQDGDKALVTVRDNGIGMTDEQRERATEKFYRGTPPYVFDYEGMGLGLHVAYVIMAAHRGDLEIKSAGQNKGSEVSLILPM